jgi:hypothetical protein
MVRYGTKENSPENLLQNRHGQNPYYVVMLRYVRKISSFHKSSPKIRSYSTISIIYCDQVL